MRQFEGDRVRPNDERRFLHKSKFGRFIGGAVKKGFGVAAATLTGGPGAGVATLLGRSGQERSEVPQSKTQVLNFSDVAPGDWGGTTRLHNGTRPCMPPLIRSPAGNCIAPTSPRGAELFASEAIAGQYGAGYIAGSRITDVATCPRGTVLGKDGVCYANLPNKNRLYPRGRRPLLTGGDMRAISRARTAGNRLANAKSDLIAIGMLKAAGPRKKRKRPVVPC